jgi:hypothetical protein
MTTACHHPCDLLVLPAPHPYHTHSNQAHPPAPPLPPPHSYARRLRASRANTWPRPSSWLTASWTVRSAAASLRRSASRADPPLAHSLARRAMPCCHEPLRRPAALLPALPLNQLPCTATRAAVLPERTAGFKYFHKGSMAYVGGGELPSPPAARPARSHAQYKLIHRHADTPSPQPPASLK